MCFVKILMAKVVKYSDTTKKNGSFSKNSLENLSRIQLIRNKFSREFCARTANSGDYQPV